MNEQGVRTKAWYCSDESMRGAKDLEFGVDVKWDIPLMEGYEFEFFKNYSWKASHTQGFFGLINLGMIRQLFNEPKSIIIVHGWHYFTHFFLIMLGKILGHTICIRNEMPQKQEVLKMGLKQTIKKFFLKYILFPRIHYFLYIGKQNYLLYKSYQLPEKRLVFCPYAIDNNRFNKQSHLLKTHISQIKDRLKIPVASRVILYTAKYIKKKNPLDLLSAFRKINIPDCWLIMVGEGKMRDDMEKFILENDLQQVVLTGFINQFSIPEYYAISDVFIMCSGAGESWGLSVNEAMNFNLPLILSDLTGCSDDLVNEGDNGFVFKTGDVEELAERIKWVLNENKLTWSIPSEKLVHKYSYAAILDNLRVSILQ